VRDHWLDVITDEACLHRRIGSAVIMRAQLEHLIEMSQRENVRLQILPFVRRRHPTTTRLSCHAATSCSLSCPSVVRWYASRISPEASIQDGILIQQYEAANERLRADALNRDESRTLLAELAKQGD
jgi:hypothetical protein